MIKRNKCLTLEEISASDKMGNGQIVTTTSCDVTVTISDTGPYWSHSEATSIHSSSPTIALLDPLALWKGDGNRSISIHLTEQKFNDISPSNS